MPQDQLRGSTLGRDAAPSSEGLSPGHLLCPHQGLAFSGAALSLPVSCSPLCLPHTAQQQLALSSDCIYPSPGSQVSTPGPPEVLLIGK